MSKRAKEKHRQKKAAKAVIRAEQEKRARNIKIFFSCLIVFAVIICVMLLQTTDNNAANSRKTELLPGTVLIGNPSDFEIREFYWKMNTGLQSLELRPGSYYGGMLPSFAIEQPGRYRIRIEATGCKNLSADLGEIDIWSDELRVRSNRVEIMITE